MKTKKSIENPSVKLSYEAPVLRSMEVELEYGIAAASVAPSQQWKETEVQSQEVQNNHW